MFGTEVAVLVADISGSTALYESIGNEAAFNRISACLDKMRAITDTYDGVFIHSKGDDVLCTFEVAQNAFDASVEMLAMTQDSPLSLHSGLDFGAVLWARGDVFGDCVNTTARLAGYAISGEFLCSHSFYNQLTKEAQARMRFLEKWRFKGKSEGDRVYAFSSAGQEMATQFSIVQPDMAAGDDADQNEDSEMTLKLTFRGEEYFCTPGKDIVIGRSVTCDLIVPKPWISRKHALIQIRRNKAYVQDTSSNGTFICFEGQEPVLARRETVLLPDKCGLSLTKEPGDAEAEQIVCEFQR